MARSSQIRSLGHHLVHGHITGDILYQSLPAILKGGEYLLKVVILALVYFLSGQFSFSLAQDNLVVTIVVFVSEGFSLAALLLFGRALWPGVLIGQTLLALSAGMMLFPSLAIGVINSVEALIGVTLFRYFQLNKDLPSIKDVFGLLALIAFVLQPFSAVLGSLVLLSGAVIDYGEVPKTLFSWWFANLLGQFLITPACLLIFAERKKIDWKMLGLFSLLFVVVSMVVFFLLPIHRVALVFSITLPLIILASIYSGRTYGVVAMVINAIVAVLATASGHGPFVSGIPLDNMVDLNFYILSHVLLVLIIGTLFFEKHVNEEKLRSMALYDVLTGLPSRNLLREKMGHCIAMAHRYDKKSAVCFIDIDNFKRINDTLGHDAGDQVIVAVADRIKQHVREDDALIRLGGDEFLLLITDVGTRTQVGDLLERIRTTVDQPVITARGVVNASLSIGVSICPDDGDDEQELIGKADVAMYQAKSMGKNAFVFFDTEDAEHTGL